MVGYLLLSVGLLLGVTGFIQSRIIKITEYDYVLPSTLQSWDNKTAILVSDTHFGLVNHEKFSNKVVKAIIESKPDFVLHAGDFYDGPANDTLPITLSWNELTKTIPVFYSPGNHEEYGDYNSFLTSIKNANVTVITDSYVEYDGMQIAGITYRNKNQLDVADNVIRSLKLDKTKPTILINHPPTFQQSAKDAGIDLMVSGHTHRGQFWPLNYIVKAIYGKYTYGKNVDNTITTITTSGVGTAGPPMRLFNTPELVKITFKVSK
jgi:predicted MPP superfamily phosphohydrolase